MSPEIGRHPSSGAKSAASALPVEAATLLIFILGRARGPLPSKAAAFAVALASSLFGAVGFRVTMSNPCVLSMHDVMPAR